MLNKESKKKTLVRILAIILAALMVLGAAYMVFAMISASLV